MNMGLPDRKQDVFNLSIKDQETLYKAYMPFIENGGLFIPTAKEYQIDDDVFMLLNLMNYPERIPAAGKVIWITPIGAEGNRIAGIGVQFNFQDDGATRDKIELLLEDMLSSEKPTHTM